MTIPIHLTDQRSRAYLDQLCGQGPVRGYDRRMGIPGESPTGCTPATVFVGWYNAHPDYTKARFDFSMRRVAVIGMGNVAIDVARILARNESDLIQSDIPDYALEALERRQIDEILVLGRRGPIQAAFTPKKLRELTMLTGARVVVDPEELVLDRLSQQELDEAGPNSQLRKNYEILSEISRNDTPKGGRIIRFRFLLSPIRILEGKNARVGGMLLERNELFRADSGAVGARGTGRTESIDVGWIFASIGYQSRRLRGLPYDEDRKVIANIDGRVCDAASGESVHGQYVVGWARSGPRGLIDSHKAASKEVADLMLEDVASGRIDHRPRQGRSAIFDLLKSRKIQYVTFDDWKAIEAAEIERGRLRGAPRLKFNRVGQMLAAAKRTGESPAP